jgi:basic amino acid/polyamine antiporter, APA family
MNQRQPLASTLLRRKPVSMFVAETGATTEGGELKRTIGLFQLTLFGVGATIGTGIFIVLNEAVPEAGPGVIVSFAIAGVTAALTALCYAELASTIPVSGSSYSYTYATLGEAVAFIVGWCLLLEYGVSAGAIVVGWGQYLNEVFRDLFGWQLPDAISQPPGEGGYVNLPAVALVVLCCFLLIRGARESALVNTIMVLIKVGILVMFILIAATAFDSSNLSPFAPFGLAGIGAAAASIFFSFIGIDAVSTAGEEVHNPRRTLPLAIVFALIIVTTLYVLVALAAVAAQPREMFSAEGPPALAEILRTVTGATWPSLLLSLGAVISLFSVTLVVLYGQTRILFAMARDGMLPELFHKVDPRTLTPVRNTLLVGLFVAILGAVVPLSILIDLTSMGTLVAFSVVSIGVMVLRRREPDAPRGFRVPGYPVTPLLSVAACLYIITGLPMSTFVLFAIWLAIALVAYFGYARRHSRLAGQPAGPEPAEPTGGPR